MNDDGCPTSGGSARPPVSRRRVLQVAAAAAAAGTVGSFWQPAYASAPGTAPGTTHGAFSTGRFADPPADSMPLVLWFWNGAVTDDLIDSTLADLRAKGISEVLVFPFDTGALQPAFFTEDWFAVVEHTLREAQRHGMRIWLFNDDFFPSGRAGGLVAEGGTVGTRTYRPRPDLRTKCVVHTGSQVTGGARVPLAAAALSVAGGRLVVDAAAYDGVRVLKDGAGWGDYTVSGTVRVESGTAGLMVRCADAYNGYLADLRADGGVDVWRQTGGAFSLLRAGTAVAGFDPGADHRLQVTVEGQRITPSLDGTDLGPVTDGSHPAGTVGVRATATQRSSWAALTVTGADGGRWYTGAFDDPSAVLDFAVPSDLGETFAASARPLDADGDAVARTVELTGSVGAGAVWTVPEGRWQLDVFSVRTLADSGGSRRDYLDLMDDEAVGLFMDAVPGEYVRRFPWAVGGVLRGFADDEPFVASASAEWAQVPWSPTLAAEIDRLAGELARDAAAGAGSSGHGGTGRGGTGHGSGKAAGKDGGKPRPAGLGTVLSAVFTDLGEHGGELRGLFWRAVSNRFSDAYYKGIGTWTGRHGLELISNPLWDEYGPAEQIKSTGNLNTAHQWAQVPGTDLISDQFQRGYYRTLPRWPASAAHQVGRERVYLEAMGAAGWQVTPSFTRQVIGAFVVRGINKVLLHARFSDSGDIVFAPPFQPENPWWNVSAPLNEWIGRLVQAARGTPAARTALLQPQRAAEAYQDRPERTAIDDAFIGAVHALEDRQVDFDFVDEGALTGDPALIEHARTSGGALAVGQGRYAVAVLPETPLLSLAAVAALTAFVDGGGTLVAVGALPAKEAAGRDADLAGALSALFSGRRAKRALRAADAPAAAARVVAAGAAAAVLTPPVPEVRVLRLAQGGEESFLVNNEHAAAVESTAVFPAIGVPLVCDPDTGAAAPAGVWHPAAFPGRSGGGTAVPLALEAGQAVLVVFRQPSGGDPAHAIAANVPVRQVRVRGAAAVATVQVTAPGTVRVTAQDGGRRFAGSLDVTDPLAAVALDGDWSFRFDTGGAPAADRPLGSWTELDPSWSGAASYERTFTLPAATLSGRRWALDLGAVRDVAEVEVNGVALPSRLWAPYRFDVTDALHAGANTVRVRVTNTGANAHGDAQVSGLLGPVLLRPSRVEEVRLTRSGG
ncbi:glycosyl hydrolase [Streptomyces sp. NBC_00669]|uniref:glycosylhydrolase-like jelly roll fold domain-containing protein n=1 Tax=Streptomyces sp. NBC_00669 TaxID=2976011 RepID=UPI002E37F8C8|nr:glycosylhydrolase-like jelly roll fold domain-containing protein [Streptomyces sp. NBC_00669]